MVLGQLGVSDNSAQTFNSLIFVCVLYIYILTELGDRLLEVQD